MEDQINAVVQMAGPVGLAGLVIGLGIIAYGFVDAAQGALTVKLLGSVIALAAAIAAVALGWGFLQMGPHIGGPVGQVLDSLSGAADAFSSVGRILGQR